MAKNEFLAAAFAAAMLVGLQTRTDKSETGLIVGQKRIAFFETDDRRVKVWSHGAYRESFAEIHLAIDEVVREAVNQA